MRVLLSMIALLCVAGVAQAETRYIVDQAKLPMRTGQSTGHSIVRMLPSGMGVKVLEQSATGYTRVRTAGGKEGWILSRYLMKSPAARDRLIWAEKELSKLGNLKKKLRSVGQERAQFEKQSKQSQLELARIRKAASNAVIIADENEMLKQEAAEAVQALESLQQATKDIRSGAQQRWFMLGGGAVLLGILLGLILPRLKFRRKERWGHY